MNADICDLCKAVTERFSDEAMTKWLSFSIRATGCQSHTYVDLCPKCVKKLPVKFVAKIEAILEGK